MRSPACRGQKILRIAQDMTLHDAAITRFGQYYNRNRRAGFRINQCRARGGLDHMGAATLRRSLLLGLALPLAILVGVALVGPWALVATLLYPLQIARGACSIAPIMAGRWVAGCGCMRCCCCWENSPRRRERSSSRSSGCAGADGGDPLPVTPQRWCAQLHSMVRGSSRDCRCFIPAIVTRR